MLTLFLGEQHGMPRRGSYGSRVKLHQQRALASWSWVFLSSGHFLNLFYRSYAIDVSLPRPCGVSVGGVPSYIKSDRDRTQGDTAIKSHFA